MEYTGKEHECVFSSPLTSHFPPWPCKMLDEVSKARLENVCVFLLLKLESPEERERERERRRVIYVSEIEKEDESFSPFPFPPFIQSCSCAGEKMSTHTNREEKHTRRIHATLLTLLLSFDTLVHSTLPSQFPTLHVPVFFLLWNINLHRVPVDCFQVASE